MKLATRTRARLRRAAYRARRRPYRTLALATLAVALAFPATALCGLLAEAAGDPSPSARTRGRDALWLGHAWVDGRRTDRDVTALARSLRTTGIRDLYVHTGPLNHDGTLPDSRAPRAGAFVAALHRVAPKVRVSAWLGDVLDTEGGPGMSLRDSATRAAVAASAARVLDRGFDGVHLDLEPAHSGDEDYLRLLDTLRITTEARGAVLSVAAHQIDPVDGLHTVAGALADHPKWWSREYFERVARRVDQIAVMSYDTAMPTQRLYTGYVARQTRLALEATPASTDLLMGLPAYHTSTSGHFASAETVGAAVRGARLALGARDPGRARFGLALYVDFTATAKDWRDYRDGWVQPAG